MNLHNEMTIRQLVESNVSKDKSFKGLDCTFDWALPQGWLDAFAEWCKANVPEVTYDIIRGSTVWAYRDGFGKPTTCCTEVFDAYQKYWANRNV